MIHEDDPLYVAEGEEILLDSLFTPGTKIYYAFRTSFLPGPGPYNWPPFGADVPEKTRPLPAGVRFENQGEDPAPPVPPTGLRVGP